MPMTHRISAGVLVEQEDRILLVRYGQHDFWVAPGGGARGTESLRETARREVREETGTEAAVGGLVDVHEVLLHALDGQLAAHYLLAVFWGTWRAGEPAAGSDAAAARFVGLEQLAAYPLTEEAERLIRRARELFELGGG